MMLKDIRKQKRLTQAECAKYLGILLRTYQNYEKDEAKASTMKYAFMMQKLEAHGYSYIPGRAMKGIRNRIVHEYGSVELSVVYDTVMSDIPDLLAILKEVAE